MKKIYFRTEDLSKALKIYAHRFPTRSVPSFSTEIPFPGFSYIIVNDRNSPDITGFLSKLDEENIRYSTIVEEDDQIWD